ncbi:MAG: hypothetical protein HY893_04970 [Deltaproteobacteria bacterium]|nr:hypothetical protein [Deltaproteobacteria bacterium]
MKRLLLTAAVATSVFLGLSTGSVVLAGPGDPLKGINVSYVPGAPANGIVASRHNLGSLSKHLGTSSTTEICVFCHTPHFTNTPNNLKPMWNRGTSAPTSFTAYGTTIGGTAIADADIGSTSLACLSCHDGVTALDNIVNAPGKGGINSSGAAQGWSFVEEGTNLGASITIGAVDGRLNIGLNLSNDHPVSVVYNGAASATDYTGSRASLRASNTTISTIDLTSNLAVSSTTFDMTSGVANLQKNLWAVKGFINPDATIADLLRGPGNNRVECSSCHDPHFFNQSWNELEATPNSYSDGGLFLRRVGGNTGSGVCRTCHAK